MSQYLVCLPFTLMTACTQAAWTPQVNAKLYWCSDGLITLALPSRALDTTDTVF